MKPKIPVPGKGTYEELKKCLDWGVKKESRHRLARFRRWERSRLYYESIQWLEPDKVSITSSDGTNFTPFWQPIEVDSDEWYPMPVMNEIAPAVQNEKARILGAGSRPYVRPKSSDTDIERAAKMATDVLKDALERLGWARKEDLASLHMPLYGQSIFKTQWELDWRKTFDAPVEDARYCTECQSVLSNEMIPGKYISDEQADSDVFRSRTEAKGEYPDFSYEARKCISCGGPLAKYNLQQEGEKDMFGRSLFEPIPIGEVALSIVSPYDFFPQNEGLDGENSEEFYEEHVESLEWIAAHYKNGYKVKAESAHSMMRWHPTIGAGYVSAGGELGGEGLYGHHAIVREFHKKPWVEADENGVPRMNRGRSIVMANKEVLLDEDFLIESQNNPGVDIPRVEYALCPWEVREREMFGISAVELVYSLQDAINCLLSQVQDARHRFGSPKILAEEGMDINRSGFSNSGYPSDIWYFSPAEPGQVPTLFGNTQMQGNWAAELDRYIEGIARIFGTMDIEIGEAPKNISAASAVMYLGEKASERRKARIARFADAKKRVYSHVLALIHEMYREERQYTVRGRNDKWEIKSFTGADLKGQDDVVIDNESVYDVKMFRREVIKDGISAGTITVDTAAAKRRINEEWGVPREINEELNNQVEMAEEEWLQFDEDESYTLAVEAKCDDHLIHFKTHALSLQQQKAKELMSMLRWNEAELLLWGWDEQYDAIAQMEQFLKSPPTPAPQPGPSGEVMPEAAEMQAQEMAMRQQIEAQLASIPKAPELRIYSIWRNMLVGSSQIEEPRLTAILRLARFKAHLMAHYILGQEALAAAGGGMPLPAAPGGSETISGVIPGNPAQAIPGPGAGTGAMTQSGDGNA
jgi:hypothetical protein